MFLARVFTLYPDFFPGPLNKGLYGKALSEKIWDLETINIRDYATDKHKTVDDTPYGGGYGMLIKPDVIANSLDKNSKSNEKIIYLNPKGKLLNQYIAKKLSKEKTINLICGHFEGVDQRVIESRNIEEVSIGDFVLSGGGSDGGGDGSCLEYGCGTFDFCDGKRNFKTLEEVRRRNEAIQAAARR